MSRVIIRPATLSDFVAFRGEPPLWRTRAWVGELDGKVIGMGGVAYPKDSKMPVIWAEFGSDAYRHGKTLFKSAQAFMRNVSEPQVACVADHTIEASRRFAERLGFRPTGQFSDDGEVFIHDRYRH